ncbi:MAG: Planctomycete cytochrome [Chthoniobacteraceae bacterium]|nr:Planctomycete cytochrome [Chthoniobacteraceae bacterium]
MLPPAMRSPFFPRFFLLFFAMVGLGTAGEVGFNRDVRPILSDKCFFCHGPDAKKREADLRLDVREAALQQEAFVPGKPDESELIARILSTDKTEHMPPAKSKLAALTPEEINTLKQWIAQGAKYEAHWAFIPLSPLALEDPAASPIDLAVAKGLASRGLQFQPEADRTTLIRRVSFDLTGLPPTPEEVDSFLGDPASNAYERLVDRLLKSERYGERMAVDWLDISRYADSFGYQVDRERDVWPWRDWVIGAFNKNLPFDQFITWQLAGDLLPNPTDDQMLATMFNRLHQQEAEGGSVEEEYRVEYVCDRVQTFATAFLGLTFECARCHDHKFDPIAQKEYYQFFSMFQNIDEAGLYSFFTTSPPTPSFGLIDAPTKERLAALDQKVGELEKQATALRAVKERPFTGWLETRSGQPGIPGELARFGFDTVENGKLANSIRADQPATLRGENKLSPGVNGNAIEFTGDDPVDLALGNFKRNEPFSVSLRLKTPDLKERAVVFHRSRAWTDAASRGYELLIEEGKLKWSLIHFWPGNAISIRAKAPVQLDQWTQVTVTYDGSSRADGLRIYIDGKIAPVEVIRDGLTKEITGGGGDNIALGERFRDRGFKGGMIDDFRVFNRDLTAIEALATYEEAAANALFSKPTADLSAADRAALFDYYLAAADPDWALQMAALKETRGEWMKIQDGAREMMVMRELPEPKKAYVLLRGQYDQHTEEVHAGTPAALSPFPDGAPKNRLGLAQWLTDRRHPLTARVTVNRFWQGIFGRGLVKTAEDFGSQGARPLYPELLDWLALHFIESGWDTKGLIKTIVMSRTYRQRSIADGKTMADDPDNEWLARGPRFRLSAEMIRDNALAAAGLLSASLGGAPVNPYEMSEAFKPAAPSGGDGVYRRSIYTNWRRTGPPPAMVAFDAPRRAVCAAKRERTDSPLQALILLNGTQYVEAARVLGEKLHREAKGDVNAMIEQGFMRCLSRKPDERERTIVRQLYTEQLAYFSAKPSEAAELLKTGNAKHDAAIPPDAAAAATVLAQALMNHDACIVKR